MDLYRKMKAVKPRRHGGGREEEGEDFFVHEKRERKSGQGQESILAVYSLPVIKDIGIPVFSVCAFHAHPPFPDFPRASVATPLLRPSSVLSWPPLFSGLPPCLRGYPSFSGSAPCLRGHPSSPAFLRASVVTHLPRLSSALSESSAVNPFPHHTIGSGHILRCPHFSQCAPIQTRSN